MVNKNEIGRIVWHDLMTNKLVQAREFYRDLLGWDYVIEHSPDFVWRPGEEADYPLIIAKGQAHGGFVDSGPDSRSHWLAWVAVEDVDVATAQARKLGATIEREAFDTPGVGRMAVIRDPQGALICPYLRTHNFPPPTGAFLWDLLVTDDIESAKTFYRELFGWQAEDAVINGSQPYALFKRANAKDAAGAMQQFFAVAGQAFWLSCLATDDVDAAVAGATSLGASLLKAEIDLPQLGRLAILADPTGAVFGVLKSSQTRGELAE